MTLPTGAHWELLAPRYGGPFATRLRVKVTLTKRDEPPLTGSGAAGPRVHYSNAFPGRISLSQFTREQGHTATSK